MAERVFVNVELEDGAVYEGEIGVESELPDGYGKMTWPDGEVYVGQWKDFKFHGKGKMMYADGDVYDGEWRDDVVHGKGRYEFGDGAVYEGNFANGARDGHGKYTFPSGECYVGGFKNDMYHGQGKIIYANGDIYDGEWENDQRNGYGTFTETDGCVYEGNWKNGEKYGFGKKKYSSGNVVSGGWNGLCNIGVVKTEYTSGSYRIEVIDKNNKRIGIDYSDSGAAGKSSTFYRDGNEISSSFVDWLSGKAKVIAGSNYDYYGEVRETKTSIAPYGNGRATFKSGLVASGKWDGNGNMTFGFYIGKDWVMYGDFDKQMNLQGFGRILMDGFYYEGDFVDGKYEGNGTFYTSKGNTYSGVFKDNNLIRLTSMTLPSGELITDSSALSIEEYLVSIPFLTGD